LSIQDEKEICKEELGNVSKIIQRFEKMYDERRTMILEWSMIVCLWIMALAVISGTYWLIFLA
jgi:hypothetical protein